MSTAAGAPRPLGVELRDDRPGDLLAVVRYTGGNDVLVRHRGNPPRWKCASHGDHATCPHVLAVDLTVQAHHALLASERDTTKERHQ